MALDLMALNLFITVSICSWKGNIKGRLGAVDPKQILWQHLPLENVELTVHDAKIKCGVGFF